MLFNFEGPKGTLKRWWSETQPTETANLFKNGGVAQLGEHLPCKQGVDSSILFISTSCAGGNTRFRQNKPKGLRSRGMSKAKA